MNAEIISVGTELLLGQTINTDAAYVARALSDIGISMLYTTTVGDNPTRLKNILALAFSRSDIIITTGGLGPTEDDLTKETIAAAAGKKLVLHEESLRRIEAYFVHRKAACGPTQKKQAMLPEGCTVFENNNGTAPGCGFETETGKLVVMLPGPPSELIPMLRDSAVPYLASKQEKSVIYSVNVHVFGKGEAQVAELLHDIMEGSNPTAAPYAKDGEMFVRVTARAVTPAQAESMCLPVVEEIKKRVGNCVYSTRYESLEELVVHDLQEAGLSLAVAESCTGGLVAKRLTDIPGASEVFGTGVVTYANYAKEKLLGVHEKILRVHGAVSPQTAAAMARGVKSLGESDIGIGITGIAGPDGGSEEKPVGLVYIALCGRENEMIIHKLPGGVRAKSRDRVRIGAASHALDMVRRYVEGVPQLEEASAGVFPCK